MEKPYYIILVYLVIREAIYQYSMQRLVNKLMSRNYYEFKSAEKLEERREIAPKVDNDMPEDLGELNGLTF